MRELKFRVWDKVAGKYLEGEEAKAFVLKLDGTHYVEMTFGYYDKGKDWVIEQYTGLKDKNGKEIYEGDILEFDKDFDDSAQRYVPYFDEKLAAFGFRMYGYQYYISESGSEEFESEMSLIGEMENYEREEIIFYTEYISIIGNIHENPELVK